MAHALLGAPTRAADDDGAVRVSLQTETDKQTETDNTAALRLYEAAGFTAVRDLRTLTRELGDTR